MMAALECPFCLFLFYNRCPVRKQDFTQCTIYHIAQASSPKRWEYWSFWNHTQAFTPRATSLSQPRLYEGFLGISVILRQYTQRQAVHHVPRALIKKPFLQTQLHSWGLLPRAAGSLLRYCSCILPDVLSNSAFPLKVTRLFQTFKLAYLRYCHISTHLKVWTGEANPPAEGQHEQGSGILAKSSLTPPFSFPSSTAASAGGSRFPTREHRPYKVSLSPYWFWQAVAAARAVLVLGLIALKAATDAAAGAVAGAASREWGSGEPAPVSSRSPYRSSAPRSCNQVARRCWSPWSSLGGPWRAVIHGWSLPECQCCKRSENKMSQSFNSPSVVNQTLCMIILH